MTMMKIGTKKVEINGKVVKARRDVMIANG